MDRNMLPLELIGLGITIIGFTYGMIRNLKADIKQDFERYDKAFEYHQAEMRVINERWERLFEKLHIVDKDVDRLKSKKKVA